MCTYMHTTPHGRKYTGLAAAASADQQAVAQQSLSVASLSARAGEAQAAVDGLVQVGCGGCIALDRAITGYRQVVRLMRETRRQPMWQS